MKLRALLLSFVFLLIIILPTVWVFPYLSHIQISGQLESFKLKQDDDLENLLQIYNRFGSKQLLICGYHDPNLLSIEGLQRLKQVTTALSQSDYVKSAISLTTLKIPSKHPIYQETLQKLTQLYQKNAPKIGKDGEVVFPDLGFFPTMTLLSKILQNGVWVGLPRNEEELQKYREDVKNPLLVGRLISKNGTYAGILLDLKTEVKISPSKLIFHLQDIAQKQLPDHKLTFLGRQSIYAYLEKSLRNDLVQCGILAVSLLALCFAVLFRSIRAILLPSVSVGISVLWMAGFIYYCEYEVNILIVLAPVFILAIGSTISIHLLSRYNAEIYRGTDKYLAIHKVLFSLKGAVFSSVLTTIIGFYALALANIEEVLHFSHVLSVGLVSCMLLNFMVFYILNTLFPRIRTVRGIQALSKFLQKVLLPPFLNHRVLTLFVFVAISGFGVYGIHHLKPRHDIRSYLQPNSTIVQDLKEVNEHLAGATLIFVHVKGSGTGTFQRNIPLERLQKLQARLQSIPQIDAVLSYQSILDSFNWLINPQIEEGQSSNDRMALQHLLSLILKNDPQIKDYFSRVMSSDYSETLFILQSDQTSLNWLDNVHRKLNKICHEELGDRFVFHVTGDAIVVKNAVTKVLSSQLTGISCSIFAIMVLILILFLSVKVTLICILPNMLPVLFFYGMLYYLGLGIDLSTGLIACVTIGIAVDNGIHFLFAFRKYLKVTFDSQEAVLLAVGEVGSPLIVTSLVLSILYCVLLVSQFPIAVRVGSLQAATMIMAMMCNLFLLPVLLSGTRIVTVLDALHVKLKFDPTTQSEFFKGLTKFQTKVVLAFGKLVHVPQGDYLIRVGEMDETMYVLVGGNVEVLLDPNTQQKITLGPGATIGEIAVIAQVARTADVKAINEVDVLELNAKFFKIISRNYPKIATILLSNLNKILVNRYILA